MQNILQVGWGSDRGAPLEDGENRADGDVDINVAGTIQWIKRDDVTRFVVARVNEVFHFLRGDRAGLPSALQGAGEADVRNDIKFHLFLPLHVLSTHPAVGRNESGTVDIAVNDLGRE